MKNLDDLHLQYIDKSIESLKEQFRLLKELFYAEIRGIEKATDIARRRVDERLHDMNQLNDRMERQETTFARKEDLDELKKMHEDDIRPLQDQKLLVDRKAEQKSVNWAIAIALVGIAIALVSLFLHN